MAKKQRHFGGLFRVFWGPWGVLGESLWSLERPRGVFGAPLERPWTRNAYKTNVFSMISNSILFTSGPSLGCAGRSLERLWGVFGAPLVPIGPFWGEKVGSQELQRAPTSSDELRRVPRSSGELPEAPAKAFQREVRRLRGSMRETLSLDSV